MARFSDQQIRRYSRQILLREVGGRGQERLQAARPVLVCAGEVGQLTADYLWRAGVTGLLLLAATPELAARLGSLTAARAVGGASRRNPIALLVPCHRVVGHGGSLTGYGGGLHNKEWLLRHESGAALAAPSLSLFP